MAASSQYPLAHLVAKPIRVYVPSWAQDSNSLRETFKRARRSVGKQTRVRVQTLIVAEVKVAQNIFTKPVDPPSN